MKPKIDGKCWVFKGEGYGAGNRFGNKYWVTISEYESKTGVLSDKCREFADILTEQLSGEPVVLGNREFDLDELTFFFYCDRRPVDDSDNWTADYIFTRFLKNERS